MIDVACYLFNAFGISTQPGRLMLSKWVNIREEIFNEVLRTVIEAKNNGLRNHTRKCRKFSKRRRQWKNR